LAPRYNNNRSILMRSFERWYFWLVLKLEISNRVIISWRILLAFRGFCEDYIFAWWDIWVSINSSFASKIHFHVNGKATGDTILVCVVCHIEISHGMHLWEGPHWGGFMICRLTMQQLLGTILNTNLLKYTQNKTKKLTEIGAVL
jgi:hypothetical protein